MIKKMMFAIIGLIIAVGGAYAQTIYDAYRYSNNTYYGTARTISMGNAFTALGGDNGAITLNPAGSAVNKFSQVTFSPGYNYLYTTNSYNTYDDTNNKPPISKSSRSKWNIPNFGLTLVFPTLNDYGLKYISFSLVNNMTSNYLNNIYGGANNDKTSYLALLAEVATKDGYTPEELKSNNYAGGYNWRSMIAYQSGMIGVIPGTNQYIGATEKMYENDEIKQAGVVKQLYSKNSFGTKHDMVFNLGFNINDKLYLGANLGIAMFNYNTLSYISEAAEDPNNFNATYINDKGTTVDAKFINAKFSDKYWANGRGVYGKFGFIYLPVNNLRIGGAIQTPTKTSISEKWQYGAKTVFNIEKLNADIKSNEGSYDYNLISPWRGNVGIGFVNKFGIVSADYEFANYSSMALEEQDGAISDNFILTNDLCKHFFGVQHSLRLGAEVKLNPSTALRLGYNFTTSPEHIVFEDNKQIYPVDYENKYYTLQELQELQEPKFNAWANSLKNQKYINANTHSLSFGLGYSSKKAFFADFACRASFYPTEYTYPYASYGGKISPEITTKATLITAVATIGWRF